MIDCIDTIGICIICSFVSLYVGIYCGERLNERRHNDGDSE